jgi:hypothetical protein
MTRWIVFALAVVAVAVVLHTVAQAAGVSLNPVTAVQSIGDENEPDENGD